LLLPKVLQKRGFHQLAVASGLLMAAQRWIETNMGPQAAQLHPKKFADGTLLVEAANAIALSEFSRRIPQLQDALKRELPDSPVRGIHCRRAAA
ncbi:MAG TPA: DciA family protein, partial [Candidatus Peribacteria bacterium]|nr:DciA family protein [Candidatus Peribacteria bacterium]